MSTYLSLLIIVPHKISLICLWQCSLTLSLTDKRITMQLISWPPPCVSIVRQATVSLRTMWQKKTMTKKMMSSKCDFDAHSKIRQFYTTSCAYMIKGTVNYLIGQQHMICMDPCHFFIGSIFPIRKFRGEIVYIYRKSYVYCSDLWKHETTVLSMMHFSTLQGPFLFLYSFYLAQDINQQCWVGFMMKTCCYHWIYVYLSHHVIHVGQTVLNWYYTVQYREAGTSNHNEVMKTARSGKSMYAWV